MSTSTSDADRMTAPRTARNPLFSALAGLTSIAILLQGLWAGIFLEHDGQRGAARSWIDVHARGGEVAIGLAALTVVTALVKLRSRKELVAGSVSVLILLAVESYLGGLIHDQGKDTLTAIHVPLALAIMALAIWLPIRARYPVAKHVT